MKNIWIVVSLSVLRQGYGHYAELGNEFFSNLTVQCFLVPGGRVLC